MIIITEILALSFPIFWEVEGRPTIDLLTENVVNTPVITMDFTQLDPTQPIQSDIPCIFAGGPIEGKEDDDTTNVDYTFFVEQKALTTPPNHRLIIRYLNRRYKLKEGGINDIFGLWEFTVIRAD